MFVWNLARWGPSPEPLNFFDRSAVNALLQKQDGAKRRQVNFNALTLPHFKDKQSIERRGGMRTWGWRLKHLAS